ncbi:restriction endonuclease, partial [Planococcus glaciei]|uniref:BREX-1 system adenine-specific DNA-methyltransferase PglX n=1 Tax=Planococcus glaciei TaxID=459472 RepID=UPI0006C2F9DC
GEYSFKSGITFSTVTSGEFGARFSPSGFLFDATGSMGFSNNNDQLLFVLSLLNSVVSKYYFLALAPTIHYKLNKIMAIPAILKREKEIVNLTKECIRITENDWNSLETAWDFKKHVFLRDVINIKKISDAYENWEKESESLFRQLKSNEESLNKIFIEIYNLETELSSEVDDKNISIRKADKESEIKSFISYAIGCSFGRFSLDYEGIVYAGGIFNSSSYKTFAIEEDNIIPILPSAYFTDDIVKKFIDFVRISFGEEYLEENLDFICSVIGRKKNETTRELLRRYFLNDFYKDHVQVYKKRPIYWLFTSGKEKAFNCLIYMHRYDKTTLSRIRTDYLHEVQIRMDAEKRDLLNIIEGDSTTKEITNARKELKSLDKKIDELKAYDELLHHKADQQIEIDLDDGVAVNYAKFEGLVAKI